jgi:hypothetical protein
MPPPLYVIANRVLTSKGVKHAVNMGANAIKMDIKGKIADGWWTDPHGMGWTAKEKAGPIFKTIASQRKGGMNVTFVWLDIKNPDYCNPFYYRCTIDRLRNLTRSILQPQGVHVLYGFDTAESHAYRFIRDGLNELEAVNINGPFGQVEAAFENHGPEDVNKRTMAYGRYSLDVDFGTCHEPDFYTCTELRQGAAGKKTIGKTYGWVVTEGQSQYITQLLDAGVDGLVFGFKATRFSDHGIVRSALADIKSWVAAHPHVRYLATNADKPWAPNKEVYTGEEIIRQEMREQDAEEVEEDLGEDEEN